MAVPMLSLFSARLPASPLCYQLFILIRRHFHVTSDFDTVVDELAGWQVVRGPK